MAIQGAMPKAGISTKHDPACENADHLGVVFVHGVGFQNVGETLIAWSNRLIRMVAARANPEPETPDAVFSSHIDLSGTRQSFIEVRLPKMEHRSRTQHWCLTEAYWAASFQEPSVATMLAWLGGRGAAARAAQGLGVPKLLVQLRDGMYVTAVVTGILVVYAAIRVITSIIRLDAVRNAFLAPLDRLLTGWSGDMHVLLNDAAQSATIRKQIMDAVHAVSDAGFPRVAIVAHSGGAVASYMALTDPELFVRPEGLATVCTYITHGQGLNAAWRLCDVGEGGDCGKASGSCLRLTENVRAHQDDLRWIDYYSAGDTVSDKKVTPPKCLAESGPADEHRIENKPSSAHGTYWDNDEEFVLPVLEELAATAVTVADSPPPPAEPWPGWVLRRHQRVGMFSLTSRILFSAMMLGLVAGLLFGADRLDQLSQTVVAVVSAIPGHELVTGPLQWLQGVAQSGHIVLRQAGAVLLSTLLVIAAAYPLIRLAPRKLAWEKFGSGFVSVLIPGVDAFAAVLPLVSVVAYVVLVLLSPAADGGGRLAPREYVLCGLVVLIVIVVALGVFARTRPEPGQAVTSLRLPPPGPTATRRSFFVIIGLMLVLGVVVVSVAAAIFGDEKFGRTGLGRAAIAAVAVWLVFKLVAAVANWRWDAWDEQERQQFRNAVRNAGGVRDLASVAARPLGRSVDLFSIAMIGFTGLMVAVAIGVPIPSNGLVPWAMAAVGAGVVLVGIVGISQDSVNSRAGVTPAEMTPLPSSGA